MKRGKKTRKPKKYDPIDKTPYIHLRVQAVQGFSGPERAETPSSSRCHLGLLLGPEVLSGKVDSQCEDQQFCDASSKASAKHHAGRAARADAS